MSPAQEPSTPAGWYPFPGDPQGRYRWWDGKKWRGWGDVGGPPGSMQREDPLIWNGSIRWQYRVISATFGSALEAELNKWGTAGWEVVSIAGMNGTLTLTGNKLTALLKRERVGDPSS